MEEENKTKGSVEEKKVETPSVANQGGAKKSEKSFFKKYDAFIVSGIVLVIAAVVFFVGFGFDVEDKTYEMGGYTFTISGNYNVDEKTSGTLTVMNRKETAAFQVQVMSDSVTYSEFSKVVDTNKDLLIKAATSNSPTVKVDSLKKEKYNGKEAIVVTVHNTAKSNEKGKIIYFASPKDSVIMAVYAQNNGKIDESQFKEMLKSVMNVKESK